jgi:carbon-monoxide dehydrogenase iron sulfur subunit
MKRVLIREEHCIGCRICELYCRLNHSKHGNLLSAYKREDVPTLSRLRVEEKKPVSFSIRCLHCDEPQCVYSCLTGALSKDPQSGVVSVDENKCIGCWTCTVACPYGAIVRDQTNKIIIKCDLCRDEDAPGCVANCPNEALILIETEDEDGENE